ncbi:AidA/PixA family protein [Telluria beijingensis]|uniref:AidA/PixA family protein n=1 Tax=Telluria beijingensis TaxID=3068633 RepID=UPI0027959935|nr:AidA/PixA family protein [Massilia sp. REN29]
MNADKKMASVRVVKPSATMPAPQTQIAIAVDTAYIAATNGQSVGTGIHMMDNQLNMDSSGEGSLELSTVCPVGSLIGFSVYPMDMNSGDKVVITGFNVSQGNVFGNVGYPIQADPNDGSYWIGQAMNAGRQTYQIQVRVTVGTLRPTNYDIDWDPFITAR